MSDVRGRIETSNISETGTGKLRYVQVQDTTDASGNYDATIQVNIDGKGAFTVNLNTMFKDSANSSHDHGGKKEFLHNIVSSEGSIKIPFDLSYRSSLAVTVTNADGFYIVWDEEVF
jgi:hypothetical protein